VAWRFLLAILLGGVCYLDRTAACQLMLHRPLVVATLMGAIFGNMAAGAQVGVVLELIYLARLPWGPRSLPTTRARPCSGFGRRGRLLLHRA